MKPYVNCKFEALGNVLKKFNKDYKVLLNNVIPCIYIEDKVLKMRADTFESYEELFLKNGLILNTYSRVDNLRKILKDNLNDNTAVVIKVDSFYQPHSKKYYDKIHKKHNVYIKDYNFSTGSICVIDEEYSDSEKYIEIEMSIEQIEKMYYGYLSNFYDTTKDLGATVFIAKFKDNSEYIPNVIKRTSDDFAIFDKYFGEFNNFTTSENIESLTVAIRFKKIKLELTDNPKEKLCIENQIKSLNRMKKLLIKKDDNLLMREINDFMNDEIKIYSLKNNIAIDLNKKDSIEKELKILGFSVEHINFQNNSINGYLKDNSEKYFFKILSKEDAQNEINGYLAISNRMPVAKLLKVIEYENCIILIHEFDKNIGNNTGLLNDLIVHMENNNQFKVNETIYAVMSEYIKNWNKCIDKKDYPMEKFFKNRVESRLIKWYENADFLNKKIVVNNEYSCEMKKILRETQEYFNSNPTEKCVLTQGDPNLLNIGIKPIFFDYATSGYNALYGEISAFFWSTIFADAYLCPKYHKASYYNHDNILEKIERLKPEIKVEFNTDQVLIDVDIRTTGIRKNIIKLLLDLLNDYKFNYNLKYFLVMRLLCVLNIENMDDDDKWYVIALAVVFYCKIGTAQEFDFNDLLDLFKEV